MISLDGIRRVLFGHSRSPTMGDPRAGEKVVVCGYLIDHPDGLVLLDTGIAEVTRRWRSSTIPYDVLWTGRSPRPA